MSELSWSFELPSLGADMDTGTVLRWYVEPGDSVKRGDLIAAVETEKSDIDVEIWQPGTVVEHLVDVGQKIPVGTPMVRMLSAGTSDADATPLQRPAPTTRTAPQPRTPARQGAPVQGEHPESGDVTTVLASPWARSLAAERQIDLRKIVGSGPGGAVIAKDLDRSLASAIPAEPPAVGASPASAEPQDRMRRVIAQRMSEANRDIPHYHLELDVDVERSLTWLQDHNESLPVSRRVLPAALFISAVAKAASRVPALNGFWSDGRFSPADGVQLAVAVSLRKGGLVTPVISDAETRTVDDIMAALKELVAGARAGALRSSWMTGASITVTNLGDNGADRVHGVIFPPQVALVGFGRVRERPWISNGELTCKPIVTVSLAADHRATDGATGSRFLAAVSHHLEHPEQLQQPEES